MKVGLGDTQTTIVIFGLCHGDERGLLSVSRPVVIYESGKRIGASDISLLSLDVSVSAMNI